MNLKDKSEWRQITLSPKTCIVLACAYEEDEAAGACDEPGNRKITK